MRSSVSLRLFGKRGARHAPIRPESPVVGRTCHINVNHSERPFRIEVVHQRHRDVVDGDTLGCPSFWTAMMGVAVNHGRHWIASEWFLEPAASEEWINFRRLAFDCLLNWRVVEHCDATLV